MIVFKKRKLSLAVVCKPAKISSTLDFNAFSINEELINILIIYQSVHISRTRETIIFHPLQNKV